MQFGAGLADDGCGELAGGALAFSRQIFHAHVQQRDIFLKPAQGFLYTGDAVSGRKHGNGSPVSHQIAMRRRRHKLQSEYLGDEAGERQAYWMASELEPASFSLEPGSRFSICSLSHFSRSSWKLWGTLRKRNPTCPLISAQATSASRSRASLVSGSVNCKRGAALLGSA